MRVVAGEHNPAIVTLLFEHARDILLVLDADTGRIVDANEAACVAYGYPRAELLQRTIFELRAADPQPVAAQMERAKVEGILFRTVHQRSDGSTFPVEVNSRGETIGDRRLLLSVVRDVTEHVRFETERDALLATTRHALEVREGFLEIASHELRSPVTNISLQLQQLRRLVERADVLDAVVAARLGSAAEDALGEVERLSKLISALLDAQQAGAIVLARGTVDLVDVIAPVVERLRERADLARSTVAVDVPAIRGSWDRIRLEQVFTNLLVNAYKYGCGRPIEISARLDGAHAEVDVRDRGIGIAPTDIGRIFEKFERAVPPAYGGLGLGLYITRRIVEAHAGTIGVESVVGEGSVFRVRLPVA